MELRSEEPECSHLLIQKKRGGGTSLVAQWLRIHLPLQGTRSGKTPHAAEQLSPSATTTEPVL